MNRIGFALVRQRQRIMDSVRKEQTKLSKNSPYSSCSSCFFSAQQTDNASCYVNYQLEHSPKTCNSNCVPGLAEGAQCPGREITRAPKSCKNVASTFFNPVHMLPTDLRFGHVRRQNCFFPGAI